MSGCGPVVWLNGDLVAAADAAISPVDAGFLRGDGLFETMRVYGGGILDLERHLARLARSAEALRLAVPAPADLARGLQMLVERNACADVGLRLTVTRGPRPPVLGLVRNTAVTVAASVATLPRPAAEDQAVALAVSSWRVDQTSPLAGHKTTSYLPYLWARQEALDRGADEALLLNHAGYVAECAAANLFAVVGEQVFTPPLSDGCLPGIVRAVILELCAQIGLRAAERHLTPADLYGADEVFITSSLREIAPVTRLDARRVSRSEFAVTRQLWRAYRARAAAQTGGKP